MHADEREKIERNLEALAKVLNFEKIKEDITAKGVVEASKIQFIASLSISQSKESLLLYEILKSNSRSAFTDFVTILQDNELDEALKLLGLYKYKQSGINRQLAKLFLKDLSSQPKFCIGMTSGSYESPNVADQSSRYDQFTPMITQTREQHYPHHSSPLKHISHDTLRTHDIGSGGGFESKNPEAQQVDYAKTFPYNYDDHSDYSTQLSKFGHDDGHLASYLAKTREQEAEKLSSTSSSSSSEKLQQHQQQTPEMTKNLRVAGGQQQQQQARSGNTRASVAPVPPERAAAIQQRIKDLSVSNVESGDDERSNDFTNNICTVNSSTNTTNNDRHYKYYERDLVSVNSNSILEFHPYEIETTGLSSREIDGNMNMNSTSATTPSNSRYYPPLPGHFESDSSSAESAISCIDPHQTVTSEIASDPERLVTMEVKMATELRYEPLDDYKMTSRPRGLCLIINNVDFEGDIFPKRRGSDVDAKRFDRIFRQLGFEVTLKRNSCADDMRRELKYLSKSCTKEHDSVFIFILSHGNETGIYGTDGLEVNTEYIISLFDNRNCKAMIGKPKVFVIQACRGMSRDNGGFNSGSSICGDEDSTDARVWSSVVSSQPESSAKSGAPPPLEPLRESQQRRDPNRDQLDRRVPTSWLPSTSSSSLFEPRKPKHPIRTDMAIVFSCLAGYVSVRNETAGSWLGVALAFFIMTHAHERDLIRILNLVTYDVCQRESSHGHIQSIELKLLGWSKNLYFNPGLYA